MSIDLNIHFQKVGLNSQEEQEEKEEALHFLSPSEASEFAHLKTQKRKSEWLAGRVACKKAVYALLSETRSSLPKYQEIILSPSNGMRPQVSIEGIQISLTHSGEWAAAMASHHHRVGIDLEKLDQPSFDVMSISFTLTEQKWILLENWRFYQFWTAKEAFLKALGSGLTFDLRELEVVPLFNIQKETQLKFQGAIYPILSNWNQHYLWSSCQIQLGLSDSIK